MTFLNHGSFGARPKVVEAAHAEFQRQLAGDPADILWIRGDELLRAARQCVADLVGASVSSLVAVTNASEAINAVLRSVELSPGQNVVATSHGYNAVTQTLRFVTNRAGACLRLVDLHPPVPDDGGVLTTLMAAVDDSTALVLIDHVASPTGLRFPVEAIIAACRQRGVPVLVDGAHAVGMLELKLDELGADFYTGNLHKWVCAPLACGFLHVDQAWQDRIHPPVISHNLGEGMQAEFCWQGTRDPTAFLTAPAAIEWFNNTFGWDSVRSYNRDLVGWAAAHVANAWCVEPLALSASSEAVFMRALELPASVRDRFKSPEDWRDWLRATHHIDVAVNVWADRWLLRLSAHIYNRPADYERLIDVGLRWD